MKFLYALAAAAGLAAAAPHDLAKRQEIDNDILVPVTCNARIAFVWARGSTEPGNMGILLGPPLCTQLKARYPGQVACQGVKASYSGSLLPNELPLGTTLAAIESAEYYLNLAFTKCKGAVIITGGYSQGSAVIEHAVGSIGADVKAAIAGVVLVGYTQNFKTGGTIPNFDESKKLVICRADDGVCGFSAVGPVVTAGHLAYGTDGSIGTAMSFYESKIAAAEAA